VSFSCPKLLLERVNAIAEEMNQDRSGVLINMVRWGIKAHYLDQTAEEFVHNLRITGASPTSLFQ